MVKIVKEVQKNLDNLPNRVQAMFDGEDGQRSPEKFGQTEWEVRNFTRAGKYKEQNRDEEYNNRQEKQTNNNNKKHQKESMIDWMVEE